VVESVAAEAGDVVRGDLKVVDPGIIARQDRAIASAEELFEIAQPDESDERARASGVLLVLAGVPRVAAGDLGVAGADLAWRLRGTLRAVRCCMAHVVTPLTGG
jgi:hypothetical protein